MMGRHMDGPFPVSREMIRVIPLVLSETPMEDSTSWRKCKMDLESEMLKSIQFHSNGLPFGVDTDNALALACWRPVVRDRTPDLDFYSVYNRGSWPTLNKLLDDKRIRSYYEVPHDPVTLTREDGTDQKVVRTVSLYIINIWGDLFHVQVDTMMSSIALHCSPLSVSNIPDSARSV